MVKGGFQGLDISGVDLTAQSPTLPGAYATCAGADGKPIRVQTADGQVECSVKKVSTNYVLAGITGDGKILSITIGSTDGISVNETVPGEATEEYLDVAIDLSTVTYSNPYTAEYDGIILLGKNSSTAITSTPFVSAKVGSSLSATAEILSFDPQSSSSEKRSCFVKKGTIFYGNNIASGVVFKFYPYKPVVS